MTGDQVVWEAAARDVSVGWRRLDREGRSPPLTAATFALAAECEL
jgi:hypothetical protein